MMHDKITVELESFFSSLAERDLPEGDEITLEMFCLEVEQRMQECYSNEVEPSKLCARKLMNDALGKMLGEEQQFKFDSVVSTRAFITFKELCMKQLELAFWLHDKREWFEGKR